MRVGRAVPALPALWNTILILILLIILISPLRTFFEIKIKSSIKIKKEDQTNSAKTNDSRGTFQFLASLANDKTNELGGT